MLDSKQGLNSETIVEYNMGSWLCKCAQKFHEQQTNYTCAPASLKMILDPLGYELSEEEIATRVHTNKADGTNHDDIVTFVKELGLTFTSGHTDMKHLKELVNDHLVMIRFFDPEAKDGHYAVIRSIDQKVHLMDPWRGPDESLTIERFNKLWSSDQPEHDRWYLAIKK